MEEVRIHQGWKITLATRGDITEIRHGDDLRLPSEDPFALLRRYLGPNVANDTGLPFCGGAIGWFDYDLARRLERLPELSADGEGIPEMAVGLYDWALVADHGERRAWLIGAGRDPATQARWGALCTLFHSPPTAIERSQIQVAHPPVSNMTREAYGRAFRYIKSYIPGFSTWRASPPCTIW